MKLSICILLLYLCGITFGQGTLNNVSPNGVKKVLSIKDSTKTEKKNNSLKVLDGDLEIPEYTLSLNPVRMNEEETITATINNVGSSNVSNVEIEYYLSFDDIFTSSDYYIGNSYISLAAGVSGTESITFLPHNIAPYPDDYYLIFRIPDENENWISLGTLTILPEGLNAPLQIYPPDYSTDTPLVPKFIISTIPDANRYEMQVAYDYGFTYMVSSSYWQFETSPTTNTLEWFPAIKDVDYFNNNTAYYWRVRVLDTYLGLESEWSEPHRYSTSSPGSYVNSPSLLSPSNYSVIPWIDATMQWTEISNANWYQIQTSTSSSFDEFSFQWTEREFPSYTKNLKPLTQYFWRVVAFNDHSISQISPYRTFTTGNHVVLDKPEYTFNDGSGMDNYENNQELYWLIQPENAAHINLSFISFNTESGYDIVTVYDGPTEDSPVLGIFSGQETHYNIISSGGKMLIKFSTDNTTTYSGWTAQYSVELINSVDEGIHPVDYSLRQNYPNPFNPQTNIKFSLKTESEVSLKLYNSLGKEIKTLIKDSLPAGEKAISFNASNLPSGVYFYKLEANGMDGSHFTSTKKMMLLK